MSEWSKLTGVEVSKCAPLSDSDAEDQGVSFERAIQIFKAGEGKTN